MTGAEESLNRAEDLLARLEAARARLDALGESREDTETAIEVLQELAELARPRLDRPRVLRPDLGAPEVPLVEEHQRLPARLPA